MKLITSAEVMVSENLLMHSLKQLLEAEMTPLLVLSSDKAQRFDCVGPPNVIHCSHFTPHTK